MRKTHFIRGLRKGLRQEVWRKKCKTFEEAVEVATAEEEMEMANKEEEVLSCFKGTPGAESTEALITGLVAALDAREAAKTTEKTQPEDRAQPTKYGAAMQPDTEAAQMKEKNPFRNKSFGGQNLNQQLPLPRPGYRERPSSNPGRWGPPPPWAYQRYPVPPPTGYGQRDRDLHLCFYCHQPGHIKRFCPHLKPSQSGNGPRRLN